MKSVTVMVCCDYSERDLKK